MSKSCWDREWPMACMASFIRQRRGKSASFAWADLLSNCVLEQGCPKPAEGLVIVSRALWSPPRHRPKCWGCCGTKRLLASGTKAKCWGSGTKRVRCRSAKREAAPKDSSLLLGGCSLPLRGRCGLLLLEEALEEVLRADGEKPAAASVQRKRRSVRKLAAAAGWGCTAGWLGQINATLCLPCCHSAGAATAVAADQTLCCAARVMIVLWPDCLHTSGLDCLP